MQFFFLRICWNHTALYSYLCHIVEQFLDVSSRQAFTSPVTHFHKSQYWNDGELAVIGRHGHRVPRADVVCLQVTSSAADMPR